MINLGDSVRILQPSLLDPEHRKAQVGVVVRLPVPRKGRPRRIDDERFMVRVGTSGKGVPRIRPVRPEHLTTKV